jgi:simple sugar transport system ATP-binding protein
MMVGRKVLLEVDKTPAKPGDVVLKVEDLRVRHGGVERLKGVSFQIRRGEILGIAGVAGNGQTELLEVLGGMIPAQGGTVTLFNEPIDITGPQANGQTRRAQGIGHVPEDRQTEGLIMPFEAWENVAFGYHKDPKFNRGALMDHAAMKADCADKMARYDVRPPNPRLPARNFSGGNQQKIVVAREMDRAPELLLIGQPTRGVDIGAIEFIHKQIIALRDQGKAILLVSVELDEIMGLSDRIAVMFDGKIMGERLPDQTDQNELGLLMAGVTDSRGAA